MCIEAACVRKQDDFLLIFSVCKSNRLKSKQTAVGPSSYFCSFPFARPVLHPSHINTIALDRTNYSLYLKTRMKVLLSISYSWNFLFLTANTTQIFSLCLSLSNWRTVFQWHQSREWENGGERERFFSLSLSLKGLVSMKSDLGEIRFQSVYT